MCDAESGQQISGGLGLLLVLEPNPRTLGWNHDNAYVTRTCER